MGSDEIIIACDCWYDAKDVIKQTKLARLDFTKFGSAQFFHMVKLKLARSCSAPTWLVKGLSAQLSIFLLLNFISPIFPTKQIKVSPISVTLVYYLLMEPSNVH